MLVALLALAISVAPAVAETETESAIERAPLTTKQAALSDGEALFAELCAVCHGVAGKGDGPAAPALAVKLSDLTMLAARNNAEFPEQRIEKVITGDEQITAHGTLEMPVWGRAFEDARISWKPGLRSVFARSRIAYLTEYLRDIQVQ